MANLTVALLSTASPAALGSMGLFADLVRDALAEHAPQICPMPISLGCSSFGAGRSLRGRLAQFRQIAQARIRLQRVHADVYHVLDGSFAYLISGISWMRSVVTVHDFIPALQARGRFPVPAPGWSARRAIDLSLNRVGRAAVVHAVSEHTNQDMIEIVGRAADAVFMTPLRPLAAGLDAPVGHEPDEAPFVLHVGNNSFYKNRQGALAVFAALACRWPRLHLVLAGPEPDGALRALVMRQGLEGRVAFVVDPQDDVLVSLYRRASVLLFPSLYEGQGWPPLEAMRFGCPVVCSRAAALPETVGDAALLCDPTDVEAFASAVSSVLSDPKVAAGLVERGYRNLRRFEMREFARNLRTLYEKVRLS